MARLRVGHRSRYPAGLTAGPVAYLTGPVQVMADLGRCPGGRHAAWERILVGARDGDTHEFAREDMAEQAWRIVGPLPGRADEPIRCPRRSWRPAGAGRPAAVGRWYQRLEAAQ